jgi:hypothetical protein
MSEHDFAFAMDGDVVQIPRGLTLPGGSQMLPRVEPSSTSGRGLVAIFKWVSSFPAMLGTLLIGAVFYLCRAFIVDPDLWWHIKNGQNILKTHSWPTTDPYSFTIQGTPWLAYEWLGDVTIGFVARFGLQALDTLLIALGCGIVLAVFYYAALRARNAKAGFVSAALLCSLACVSFNLRPQMFGYLFLVLVLIVLEKFRQGHESALYFLPPLFLIWVNTHGSWIVGFGVLLVTIVSGIFEFRIGSVETPQWTTKQRVQLELGLLASLAMLAMTPYGVELAAFPFEVASKHPLQVASVMEWQPMPFNVSIGKLFLAFLVAAALLQILYHFTFRLGEWLLVLGGAAMACLHVRFLLLFVPFFAPLFAIMLARWIPVYDRKKDKFLLNGFLMAAIAVAILWYFPSRPALQRIVDRSFPTRAVNYLRNHPAEGRFYNTYGAGGYLIWALPEQRVFIDGRSEPYESSGVLADYLQVADLKPAAFSVLDSYGIGTCLLQQDEPLAIVLAHHPDWRKVYMDDANVIFVRTKFLANGGIDAEPRISPARSQHVSK